MQLYIEKREDRLGCRSCFTAHMCTQLCAPCKPRMSTLSCGMHWCTAPTHSVRSHPTCAPCSSTPTPPIQSPQSHPLSLSHRTFSPPHPPPPTYVHTSNHFHAISQPPTSIESLIITAMLPASSWTSNMKSRGSLAQHKLWGWFLRRPAHWHNVSSLSVPRFPIAKS